MAFDSIRKFILAGDLPQAIRLFSDFLKKEKKSPEAIRILQVLESQLSAIQQKERKGILDLEESQKAYNKITDAILGLADDLEAGRVPKPLDDMPAAPSKAPWVIGLAILGVLVLIAVFMFRRSNKPTIVQLPPVEQKQQEPKECPDFDERGFRVLLIPFQKLGGDDSKPELGIQTRIRDLTKRNNVDTDVKILKGNRFSDSTPDDDEANKTGKICQADMVIWGQYENEPTGISVDVRYVFTQNPNFSSGSSIEKFKNLTELKSNQMKFNSLEQAVFSLCTMMALHEGNTPLAEKWLDKIEKPTKEMLKIRKMLKEGK
ncbi:MAG: hypothetical protein JNJ57_22235 [Saprospiraceae bacterium]|nr:hypothetical protein [Saprospiraceae bacterium]